MLGTPLRPAISPDTPRSLSPENRHGQRFSGLEPKFCVDLHRPCILGRDVQKRNVPTPGNFANEGRDQRAGTSASAMLGMSANRADLSETRQAEPLSGHGGQTAILANPQIGAEFRGAPAE